MNKDNMLNVENTDVIGFGELTGLTNKNYKKVESVINNIITPGYDSTHFDLDTHYHTLTIVHSESDIYSNNMFSNLMCAIAKLGLSGIMDFNGTSKEDGSRVYWRFELEDGNAYYCRGQVVYEEPTIKRML